MNNNSTTYQRLGDYIREVDVRNADLKVSKLVGLTIAKAFIPSVANTIGTDLSKYKIIKENQFACSLMQVSRDGKMPIAIYKGEDAIMSPAYPVFEVYKDGLLPDYLQMWFSRSEFDREAVFYAVGGVRGSLDWDDFMDMKLPIPTLAEQRRIVSRYQAIQGRIAGNKQTIAKLEEAAQALYRKMFVDDIDVENLPEGWRRGTLGEVAEIKNGKTISADAIGKYPVFGGNGIVGKTNFSNAEDVVVIGRVGINCGSLNLNIGDCWVNDNAMKAKSDSIHYLYMLLKQLDLNSQSEGSGQPLLTQGILNVQEICIPDGQAIEKFENYSKTIFDAFRIAQKENEKLTELLSMVMA